METPEQIVNRIISRYGEVIDLRANPSVMIEILRQFHIIGDEPGVSLDGGSPPGGTPPGPPPGPTSIQGIVRNEDLMRAILKLSRELAGVKKLLTERPEPVKAIARKAAKRTSGRKAGRARSR